MAQGRERARAVPPAGAFPIVGIGVSAGGLSTLDRFLAALPSAPGMAFVVVQHLAPDYDSPMPALLQPRTTLRVQEADDGMRVEADHLYVIPPNRQLTIREGRFRLSPLPEEGTRRNLDVFLRSLSADVHERAVAVILSGAGSDGAEGVRDVDAAGGLVIVQSPESAARAEMIRAAVDTGVVGHVVPVEAIPSLLLAYTRHPSVTGEASDDDVTEPLQRILGLIRTRTAAERREAEEAARALYLTLERQVAERTATRRMLQEVATIANEARSLDRALDAALASICRHAGWLVGHACLAREDDETGAQRFVDSGVWYLEDEQGLARFIEASRRAAFAPGEGLIGRVVESREPEWRVRVGDDPEYTRGEAARAAGLRTALAAPVLVQDRVVGILEFYARDERPPDPTVLDAVAQASTQLGRVVERQEVERQIANAAIQEQRRIGQELHDTVNQQLTGIAMLAESLKRSLEMADAPQAEDASRLVAYLQDAQDQAKALGRGLVPNQVAPDRICEALKTLTDRTRVMYGVDCRFDCPDLIAVDSPETATHLVRIVQEAVHNAVKHGEAPEIDVHIALQGDEAKLTVRDNGLGFRRDPAHTDGMGLRIMRYRAREIGARLAVSSRPGEATAVTCTLPRGTWRRLNVSPPG